MLAYALRQNKGNADGLQAALSAGVPHMYGDHTGCGSWCGHSSNPLTYKHSGLPYGRDLTNQATKAALSNLFNAYAQSAAKLDSSSQVNESFNNTVSGKQPKSRSYASSASFNYRVAAAVCQKNIGYSYVTKVLEEAGLSPTVPQGVHHASRIDRKRKQDRERESERAFKR